MNYLATFLPHELFGGNEPALHMKHSVAPVCYVLKAFRLLFA